MKYVGKRFITLIITLLCISAVTFAAFSVIPGNASLTRLGTDATPEQVAALEHELGLDQPVTTRYIQWLSGVVRGDFGMSYKYDNTTVASLLTSRLAVTVLLAAMSFLLIPAGDPFGSLFGEIPGCGHQYHYADNNGDPVVFSRDHPYLYIWPGAEMVSAGQICAAG